MGIYCCRYALSLHFHSKNNLLSLEKESTLPKDHTYHAMDEFSNSGILFDANNNLHSCELNCLNAIIKTKR